MYRLAGIERKTRILGPRLSCVESSQPEALEEHFLGSGWRALTGQAWAGSWHGLRLPSVCFLMGAAPWLGTCGVDVVFLNPQLLPTLFFLCAFYLGWEGSETCQDAHMEAGDNLTEVVSSHHTGSRDQTHPFRFDGNCLYLLSHLVRPRLHSFVDLLFYVLPPVPM